MDVGCTDWEDLEQVEHQLCQSPRGWLDCPPLKIELPADSLQSARPGLGLLFVHSIGAKDVDHQLDILFSALINSFAGTDQDPVNDVIQ